MTESQVSSLGCPLGGEGTRGKKAKRGSMQGQDFRSEALQE